MLLLSKIVIEIISLGRVAGRGLLRIRIYIYCSIYIYIYATSINVPETILSALHM